jgi:hypothetical protein
VRRSLLIAIAVAMLAPATASAGGWATATLSSTPTDVRPGEPWKVDMKILQHGKTPLEGISPAVVITMPDGTEKRFFGAPTSKPGVYRTTVTFPKAGRYSYKIDDGFTNAIAHDFGAVQIGGDAVTTAAGGTTGDDFPWWILAVAFAVAGFGTLAYASRQRAFHFSRSVAK